jgi:hypothetical protein
MHDPQTVAFEIKRPWPHRMFNGWSYRPAWVVIWHVDPESDGSDDSCGFSRARIPKKVLSELDFEAGLEAQRPWLLREDSKQPMHIADVECLLRGAILHTAHICRVRCSYERASRLASRLLHNPVDHLRSSLCFLPGYHSNCAEDREDDRKDHALSLYRSLARILLTEARPWWRHPRWHFWHWKIQVVPLQDFKRWVFTRCYRCGKRFGYGEAPVSTGSSSKGPRWFRSETHLRHGDCARPGTDGAKAGPAMLGPYPGNGPDDPVTDPATPSGRAS